jgi:hypothetical protein
MGSAFTVGKQATSKRTALSGWLNKVDGVDTVDDVEEVDDSMVEEIMVEMVADTTLDVMEAKLGHHRAMPTWQKCKLRSCNSVWQLTRRRKSKPNTSLLVKVSQKTVDWQFLVVTRIRIKFK